MAVLPILPSNQNTNTMHNIRKNLLAVLLTVITVSCTAQNEEVFVTANTNLCPNCFNQYRMLDSINDAIPLHLVFQNLNQKEAKKFTDKFLHITRDFDIVCNDSLYASLSHNIFPWLYYHKEGTLIFDANLNQYEKWIPIINRLHEQNDVGKKIAQLPDEITLSADSRCISLKDSYLFMDFTYNELHLFDPNFKHLIPQNFQNVNFPSLYHDIFDDLKTWKNVSHYASKISPYIPDFGKVKIDNGCVFHDTLFLLVNVNYIETYFNEKKQDSAVKVMNESVILGMDGQLNIQKIYPLRFRDSLRFDDFIVNAYTHCVFQIQDWDNIILSISQKEETEKRILCRMERTGNEIRFKSLVDTAFIPEFNDKHQLGTKLCLIKADEQNAYFNAAPVITNYESGRQIELPFSNENAHFDLKHGIAEADYILADAVQTHGGDYLLLYYLQSKNKLSLIDNTGSFVWTLHLPDHCKKAYLVNEKTALFIGDDNILIRIL
jgi:hypothetical protein